MFLCFWIVLLEFHLCTTFLWRELYLVVVSWYYSTLVGVVFAEDIRKGGRCIGIKVTPQCKGWALSPPIFSYLQYLCSISCIVYIIGQFVIQWYLSTNTLDSGHPWGLLARPAMVSDSNLLGKLVYYWMLFWPWFFTRLDYIFLNFLLTNCQPGISYIFGNYILSERSHLLAYRLII